MDTANIQTTMVIFKAYLLVEKARNVIGCLMARYRSIERHMIVKTLDETETPERKLIYIIFLLYNICFTLV